MSNLQEMNSVYRYANESGFADGFISGFKAGLKDAEPKWIPVSERLPEELGYYLTSTEYHDVLSDFFCDGKWETAERFWYNVEAWMPLPDPYKGVD